MSGLSDASLLRSSMECLFSQAIQTCIHCNWFWKLSLQMTCRKRNPYRNSQKSSEWPSGWIPFLMDLLCLLQKMQSNLRKQQMKCLSKRFWRTLMKTVWTLSVSVLSLMVQPGVLCHNFSSIRYSMKNLETGSKKSLKNGTNSMKRVKWKCQKRSSWQKMVKKSLVKLNYWHKKVKRTMKLMKTMMIVQVRFVAQMALLGVLPFPLLE